MEGEKAAGKDRVVVDPRALFGREARQRRRTAAAVHGHAALEVAHPHRSAEHRALVEVVLGVAVRRQLVEVRVHGGAVVALAVVMEEKLPVRVHLVDGAMDAAQLRQAPVPEPAEQPGQRGGERRRLRREVQEDETLPDLERHWMQRIVRAVEARHLFHVGSGAQGAVEAIGPGVVRALDGRAERRRALLAKAAAAVAAVVVESAQLPRQLLGPLGAFAQDDHALVAELEKQAAAGGGELRDVAGQQPGPREDALALDAKNLLGGKVLAGESVLARRRARLHGVPPAGLAAVRRRRGSGGGSARVRRGIWTFAACLSRGAGRPAGAEMTMATSA